MSPVSAAIAGTQSASTRMADAYAARWDRTPAGWAEDEAARLAADLPPKIPEGDGGGWERYERAAGEIDRYFVYHRAADFSALLAAAGLQILDTARRSTHRDWLTLHVRRPPGVH